MDRRFACLRLLLQYAGLADCRLRGAWVGRAGAGHLIGGLRCHRWGGFFMLVIGATAHQNSYREEGESQGFHSLKY